MSNNWISVDVEADGPAPGMYSMIALGAVLVNNPEVGFIGYLQPISEEWQPEALAISGFSREDTLEFPDPSLTMAAFNRWIKDHAEPPYIFAADNNGFDWQFVNYYFWRYLGHNPFGFSSKNINSIFHGLTKNSRASFKHLRKTKHDHNPMHDARGNAEALQHMRDEMDFKVTY